MNIVECGQDAGCAGLWPIVFAALFFFVVLTSFAYTTLLERRLIAFFQQRIGPNRVGPLGFLQPAADGVKLVFKEDFRPAGAYRAVYTFAPLIKVLPVMLLFGVIPIGPPIILPWFAPSLGDVWFRVPLGLADPNVGLLWLLGHHEPGHLRRGAGGLGQQQQVRDCSAACARRRRWSVTS